MMDFADLHIHTNYSDGSSSPQQVIKEAKENGLQCIAITDHDTFGAVKLATDYAKEQGIEVIPGVELSSEISNKDIHILGYFANCENEKLIDSLKQMQNIRMERMKKMIDKLKGMGINNITFEETIQLTNSNSVGRLHLAIMLKKKNWVNDISQAFDKYIGEGKSAYIPKFKQTPAEAIRMIKGFGGVAVLAHPMLTSVDELIPGLVKDGLEGLEVYYPNVSEKIMSFYSNLAKKYDLIMTGGSDSHGDSKDSTYIGKVKIPYSLVEALKEKL